MYVRCVYVCMYACMYVCFSMGRVDPAGLDGFVHGRLVDLRGPFLLSVALLRPPSACCALQCSCWAIRIFVCWFCVVLFLTLRRLHKSFCIANLVGDTKLRSKYKIIHSSYFPQAETKADRNTRRFTLEISPKLAIQTPPGRPWGPIRWTKMDLTKWRLVKSQPSKVQPRRKIPSHVTTKSMPELAKPKPTQMGQHSEKSVRELAKPKLAWLAKPSRHRLCTSLSASRVIEKNECAS